MLKFTKVLLVGMWSLATPLAFAADTSSCTGCHADDEFAQLSADEISAAVKDTGISPHKRFADIGDAELAAIAAELAGS